MIHRKDKKELRVNKTVRLNEKELQRTKKIMECYGFKTFSEAVRYSLYEQYKRCNDE